MDMEVYMAGLRRVRNAALICVTSALAWVTAANAQGIALPDNTYEGFNATRFENEYKLFVPDAQVKPLWDYLNTRYKQGVVLPDQNGVRLTAVFSDEFFTDVYFDTPGLTLLKMKSAVRHRSRDIPGQPQNRKDGRQLMQIKLNMPGEDLTRTEVKFPIKYYEVESQEDKHPVIGLIDRDHRADFSERLRAVGIDPWSLREALTLHQRRRRVYLSDSIGAYATLTVDETSSKKFWLKSKFTEIELELNEIRYSAADSALRAEMQRVTDAVKADVMNALPGIVQDQTPKYNKSYDRLIASSWAGAMLMRASVMDMKVLGGAGGVVVFALWVLVMMIRKRREDRRRGLPASPDASDRIPTRARSVASGH
jgi:hypothetical protein